MQSLGENAGYVLNAVSIDVEEWYQTILFYNGRSSIDKIVTSLPENVYQILSLLKKYNTKATFFIVGSVAEKYPHVVELIVEEGHEIASHGYLHRLAYKMSQQEFATDVYLSIDALKRIAKSEIIGYRAPTWSITEKMRWALSVLKSAGLKYDSSIYPCSLDLLNSKKIKRFPHRVENDFIEFPPSTFKLLGYNFPFAGGIFLRFFSLHFISRNIKEINRQGYPAVIYFHSWEFDVHYQNFNIPKLKYFIQYANVNSVRKKFELLLENLKFSSIQRVLRIC